MTIVEVDPEGTDAALLLREAAAEARALYRALPGTPWPSNPPTPAGGVYLIGYREGVPVASGALRPIDQHTVEVRRVFVSMSARRTGLGMKMLRALEAAASRMGYRSMKLETGSRQASALALYAAYGFTRIEPFGDYVDDPTSVCFEKAVARGD